MTFPTQKRGVVVYELSKVRKWNIARAASGVVAIAAAYVYFLIFAQFAFVKLVQAEHLNQDGLRIVMACMGIAGICASLVAGRVFRPESRAQRVGLITGFTGCGIAAALALYAQNLPIDGIVAVVIGVSLGMLTVNLAAGLPFLFGHGPVQRHRGLCVGIATGMAYAVCNIPSVFTGTPHCQTLLAIAACIAGIIATGLLGISNSQEDNRSMERNAKPAGSPCIFAFGRLVAIFLALVWLDSAAFNILQTTPELNQFGWGDSELQWKNAAVHLVAAILAGFLLDSGWMRRILLAALVALVGAALCVSAHTEATVLTHWLYATGVSFYSTTLVFAPTADRRIGISQAAFRAGVLYAVAGWAGSALGIGMVQDLHRIPLWFLGLAGAITLCCYGSLTGVSWSDVVRRAALIAGIGTLAVLVTKTSGSYGIETAPGTDAADAGREVYISEGCLNCHTQFVRRGTVDELWWGPASNPESLLRQAPPLIGNRRQGPDLANIGNRRSSAWNRIHLINPCTLSPDSRMPSYAYLFVPNDSRGDALVAYLASLGEGTYDVRIATCLNWCPAPNAKPIVKAEREALFQESCAQCHGSLGRGDGPIAANVGPVPPRNLTLGQWHFFAHDSPSPSLGLARTIKFGVAGTSMPGHELFSDSEVLGLVEYVQSLRHSPSDTAATP
jgi:cytochrome c oxidase cbb3-type subunit 2